MIGRLIRLVFGGFMVVLTSMLIAAAVAKQRIASVGTGEDDEIALAAIFEPVEFESHATSFRGGSVLLWFGGGDVDLRGVRLDPAGARLTIRAIFGGGRLIVPDTWDVDLRMRALFGGSSDVRPAFERAPDAPHLIVDGFSLFGGLAVFASKPEIDEPAEPELQTV
jgi:hypothetical protein